MTNKNSVKGNIVRYIIDTDKTTYGELSKKFNISKRTIAKKLEEIEHEVLTYGVTLIRKQNQGVFFEGTLDSLNKYLQEVDVVVPETKEDRSFYIYFRLLMADEFLTLQDLSEELFVSYGTLANDMKIVNQLACENGVVLVKNRNGVKIDVSESQRRELVADLINHCWGKPNYLYDQRKGIRSIEFPTNIKNMFKENILKEVLTVLSRFSEIKEFDLTDYEFQSLTIHLAIAINRIKEGNFIATKVSEYILEESTKELVELLESHFQIVIPEYEMYYLNIHMLAIDFKAKTGIYDQLTVNYEVDEEIVNLIKTSLKDVNIDSELLQGLSIHLQSAVKRLQYGLSIHNPYAKEIQKNFPRAFEESLLVRQEVIKQYGVEMNNEECGFVALHIESFHERKKEERAKLKVILVCSSGVGTSRLLEQKIKKQFSNELDIINVVSLNGLEHTDIEADLVISTVKMEVRTEIPVIVVNPFLYERDKQVIREKIANLQPLLVNSDAFMELIDEKYIWIRQEEKTFKEVITFIGQNLMKDNITTKGTIECALSREALSTTANGIMAIPHVSIEHVSDSRIGIYINENGIYWDDQNHHVKVVFFVAINMDVSQSIGSIYEYFNELIDNKLLLEKISLEKEKSKLIPLLKGEEIWK